MLTLDCLIDCILEKKHWQSFDLLMTEQGFVHFGNEDGILNQRKPKVYIHVCDEGVLKNKVLRIGKAESGIYQRWVKAKNGHRARFLWATGDSELYGHKNAERYPEYLLFFASLYGLKTKIYTLTCQADFEGKMTAQASEKALIGYFSPMWEDLKKLYKNFVDPDNRQSVTALGGSIAAIRMQRSGEMIFSKQIPDLIDLGSNIGGSIERL
jgi:hypothetical protein